MHGLSGGDEVADGEGGRGGEGAVHVRRAQVQGDGQRGRAPQERFESYKVKYLLSFRPPFIDSLVKKLTHLLGPGKSTLATLRAA